MTQNSVLTCFEIFWMVVGTFSELELSHNSFSTGLQDLLHIWSMISAAVAFDQSLKSELSHAEKIVLKNGF